MKHKHYCLIWAEDKVRNANVYQDLANKLAGLGFHHMAKQSQGKKTHEKRLQNYKKNSNTTITKVALAEKNVLLLRFHGRSFI